VTNSIQAQPFVLGKEIAEALIIVFACMFFASCNVSRTFNGTFRGLKGIEVTFHVRLAQWNWSVVLRRG
jgi:hypothetical protein